MNVQQQINLYQPIFRKQEKVFSARTMSFVFVGTIVFFAAIYGYARWNVFSLVAESEKLAQSHASEMRRLDDLSRRYPVKQKSRQIETELENLQKERKAKQFLVKTLSGRSIGNDEGFSSYFEGVARQRPAGMWLRHFELEQGGEVIGIHGSSLQPELVPEFLQRLSEEASFGGSSFRIFQMQRDEKNAAAVNFTLRSVAGGEKK
jgi:hypothetical protein